MIALDTNILVAIHRRDSPSHPRACSALADAGADTGPSALPWPCVHDFVGVMTHPRIFAHPSSIDEVISIIDAWRARPRVRFLAEDETYWTTLSALDHGVRELWTADRDFSRFPKLRTRNPLVG